MPLNKENITKVQENTLKLKLKLKFLSFTINCSL